MREAVTVPAAGGAARQAAGLPRLLPPVPGARETLHAHLARRGPLPAADPRLIDGVREAGLTGRGGAAFPVYRKLAAVAGQRGRKVVVANGAESEPASHKDAALLHHAPHLVLDGLQLAADAVGASRVYLYLHDPHQLAGVLAERAAAGIDRRDVTVVAAPSRFLSGQETALVNRIGGGPALPTFGVPRVSERGIAGAPTLVQNVETLAHLALIARYGPEWFRAAGTADEPGSMLATLHTGGKPRVIEAGIGTPLEVLIPELGQPDRDGQALLVGGYHGTWLPLAVAGQLTLANDAMKPRGATLGAGVIAVLPSGRCGLAEVARVTRYLAAESAGQCGPCLNGLPRIATAMAELAGPRPRRKLRDDTERWAALVTGRGACHHPDGTTRFVRSALQVFTGELRRHGRGQCSATTREPFLPLPSSGSSGPSVEADWT